MRLYFSGTSSIKGLPEILIRDKNPDIMLSYFEIHRNDGVSTARMNKHLLNLKNQPKKDAKRKS